MPHSLMRGSAIDTMTRNGEKTGPVQVTLVHQRCESLYHYCYVAERKEVISIIFFIYPFFCEVLPISPREIDIVNSKKH